MQFPLTHQNAFMQHRQFQQMLSLSHMHFHRYSLDLTTTTTIDSRHRYVDNEQGARKARDESKMRAIDIYGMTMKTNRPEQKKKNNEYKIVQNNEQPFLCCCTGNLWYG